MIFSKQNETGIININKSCAVELVNDALKPWLSSNKLKLTSDRTISMNSNGVFISFHISFAFGESINEFGRSVIDKIADGVISSLQLPLDNIVIYVDSMFTQKGSLVSRNIVLRYRED